MKTLKLASLALFASACTLLATPPPTSPPVVSRVGLSLAKDETPAERTAETLALQMDQELARRVRFRQQAWVAFWANPSATATPQAILSALGTKAVKMLTVSAADAAWFTGLAQSLGQPVSTLIDPKYLAPKAGWTITPHQDGTATAVGVE